MKRRAGLWAWRIFLPLTAFTLAGCPEKSSPVDVVDSEPEVVYLSSPERALRVSMALRGQRPTVAELEQVEADPDSLSSLVDQWLETDAFGETLRDIHHEIWTLRSDLDLFPILDELQDLDITSWEVNRDLFEAPLRLIEDVVRNDRPYSEIVTADYLLANDIVAVIWDVAADTSLDSSSVAPGDYNWRRMRWNDGRPDAGILSSSALFSRHPSNGQNYQRGRAQTIANALLCHNYLDQEIPIDGSIDLTNIDELAAAVVANPTCLACHQTLDPLGSYLSGHRDVLVPSFINNYPVFWYNKDEEIEWQQTTKRPPGFYGDQGGNLQDLGEHIAADPRFARCTVERLWSWFHQQPRSYMPFALRHALSLEFASTNYDAKALIKALVLDPDFAVAYTDDEEYADEVRGYLKLRPAQLARLVESLMGFQWTTDLGLVLETGPLGTVDLLRSELLGYRTLFGGVDGFYGSEAVDTTTITASLVLEQVASHGAEILVQNHFNGDGTGLLSMLTDDWGDEDMLRSALVELNFRLFAERLDPAGEELSASYDLLTTLHTMSGDPIRAWTGLLSALFRDPRLMYY